MTIRQIRQAQGLTQKALAEASGVNVRQIQRLESGTSKVGNATVNNILAICKALGVGINELTDEEEEIKLLKMMKWLTKEAEDLEPIRKAKIMQWEQAKEYSGFRKYPTTCQAIFDQIPDEWIEQYGSKHVGEIAKLVNSAYSKGKLDK